MQRASEAGLVAYVAMTMKRSMEPTATTNDITNNFDGYMPHAQAVIDVLRPILDEYERLYHLQKSAA
jgi:hypothetical protein